jgi:hypothetical protein
MKAEQYSTNGHADADAARPRELCFSLSRDAWGQLTLIDAEGVRHANVLPVPMFPISDSSHWVSLVGSDGHEIVCVEDPQQLAADVRAVLEEELARREFVPIIERITWVSGNSEPCEWRVDTDRGPTQFVLKNEEDVRRLGPHQILIVDAKGIRYQIPDLRSVDAKSRRIVEWYV